MQDNNTKLNTDITQTSDIQLDPIQEAYDNASYDVKKYLDGDQFIKMTNLISEANKADEVITNEINFICLMIVLKIIDYNRNTGKEVINMLIAAGADSPIAEQIWRDIETYIIPNVPELGLGHIDDGVNSLGDMTVNRSVTIDTHTGQAHITHFGPESVEMRLKNIGAPRITLAQLSSGSSLLHAVSIDKSNNNTIAKVINHESHLDPYRELVD